MVRGNAVLAASMLCYAVGVAQGKLGEASHVRQALMRQRTRVSPAGCNPVAPRRLWLLSSLVSSAIGGLDRSS